MAGALPERTEGLEYLIIIRLYEDGTPEWQHDLAEEHAYNPAQRETAENLHQAYNGIKAAARMEREARQQSAWRWKWLRAQIQLRVGDEALKRGT